MAKKNNLKNTKKNQEKKINKDLKQGINHQKTTVLQHFKKDQLNQRLSPLEAVQFLETFRLMRHSQDEVQSKLISIKVPEDLLMLFRRKAEAEGIKYQTKIKNLMREYLLQLSLSAK